MTDMLRTRSFKQSKMMCGPASLKVVAMYFGIRKSERELARLCKANTTIGTLGKDLAAAARAIGFNATIIDKSDFKTIQYWLNKDVPVIVDWMSPGQSRPVNKSKMAGGHYSVVVGLTPTHIVLEDPGIGQKRKIERKKFLSVWFDFDYEYMKKKSDLILRRLIVVQPRQNPHRPAG
jgi:ABC-type bacteriocin/lantibiotic exporter with double-glycine peptidase domain